MNFRWFLRWALVVIPACAVLYWHARSYLPFMADDAFISLRYADRLLHGQGLTWSDGPRVEGYSNLLWVLTCAAVGLFTNLVTAARIVAEFTAYTTLAAFGIAGAWRWSSAVGFAVAASAVALTGPFAVWTVGGLEQPMLCATIAWAVVSLWKAAETPENVSRLWWPGAALALAILTRPDSPLFVACAAVAVALTHGFAAIPRSMPRLLALPVGAFVGQLLFRLAYYGEWVPNTARLKTALSSARINDGTRYLTGAVDVLAPLLGLAVLSAIVLVINPKTRRLLPVTLLPAAVWASYVVTIGGDIFPGRRHLVVVVVLLALQSGLGLSTLLAGRVLWKIGGFVAAVGLVFFSIQRGLSDPNSLGARGERWEWEAETTGPFFGRVFGPAQPLIGIDAAGALGFFSRLPAIDMLGLNDFDIPRRLPATWGQGPLSYELHNVGNADSVLERRPDLIIPCGPSGSPAVCPSIPWSSRLFAHPQFQQHYLPLRYHAEGPGVIDGTVWLRRNSAIAQTSEAGELKVLAPLLARGDGVLKLLDGAGVVELPPHGQTSVQLNLPPSATLLGFDGDANAQVMLNNGTLVVDNPTSTPITVRAVSIRP